MSLFPAGWQVEPLSTVCSEIVDCLNKTATVVDGPTPYKMIRTTNVKDGRVNLEETRFVDEVVYRKWTRRFKPRRGDVILTREAPLGEVGLLRSDEHVFLGQRTMAYRANPQKLDQRFIYYSLLGPTLQAQIRMYGAGSTVEHMRVPQAESLQIPFPALATQKKIAAILSAYDDLIANNQRRITLLERMAEDIYREWFVRLRFPGHEGVKIEKGVPQGWSITPSDQAFDVLGGGTPNTDTSAYWSGDIPFFTPKDAAENIYVLSTEKNITEKGLNACSTQLFPKNTVFITARGTVGKLALAGRAMAMNQSCYALKPRQHCAVYFHYLAIRESIAYIKGVSKSGVFDNIVMDTFKNVPLLMPSPNLHESFNQLVEPIFVQIANLLAKNQCLVSTRDALLPRLISGKLSVDALDIRFPPGMAEAG